MNTEEIWMLTAEQARALREHPVECGRKLMGRDPTEFETGFYRAIGKAFDGKPEGGRLGLLITRQGVAKFVALPAGVDDAQQLELADIGQRYAAPSKGAVSPPIETKEDAWERQRSASGSTSTPPATKSGAATIAGTKRRPPPRRNK